MLDTGSATTILNADILSSIGIKPEASDTTAQIVGIGGEESVYNKNVDYIKIENNYHDILGISRQIFDE